MVCFVTKNEFSIRNSNHFLLDVLPHLMIIYMHHLTKVEKMLAAS